MPRKLQVNKPYEVVCDITTPRDKWLEFRQQCVGASDTYLNAALIAKKINPPSFVDNDFSWLGRRLEQTVIDFARERRGFSCRASQTMLRSTLYPAMSCTLDAVCKVPQAGPRVDVFIDFVSSLGWHATEIYAALDYKQLSVMEIKTADHKYLSTWESGTPPRNYWIQCQHQLAVTGFEVAWLCGLVGGNRFRAFRIERDEIFIKGRAVQCEEFMLQVARSEE